MNFLCPEEEKNISLKLLTQETNKGFIVCKGMRNHINFLQGWEKTREI